MATYKLLVNGRTVAEMTGNVTICPYNQWNSAMVLLPAYMTPNHPYIIRLLQEASKWLQQNGKSPSLEGYQGDKTRVDEMVCGVYHAVKAANIVYSNPPASFFGPQRIRLCDEVLDRKFATCLDMTVLFASCLESFGLHPVLVTAPGHIFAGVWMSEEGHLKEPVISDPGLLCRLVENKELMVVECTAMNAGKDADYDKAKLVAEGMMKALAEHDVEEHECIDVRVVRAIGIKPVPIRVQNIKGKLFSEAPSVQQEVPCREKTAAEVRPEMRYRKEVYHSFSGSLKGITAENFYDKENRKILKDAIAEIVSVEGPVSQPDLIRTLISGTDFGRASQKTSEYLDKIIASAQVKITRQNGVRFLWKQGADPAQYMVYRFKEKRDAAHISKYELKNAVCYLIQENGPMTSDELKQKMTSLLGYNRSGKKIEDGTVLAIKAAKELKAIQKLPDGKYSLLIE